MGLTAGGGGGSAQLTINSVAAAAYTLEASDAASVEIQTTNAGAVTITLPPDADVTIPIGSVVHVTQHGAGQVTIAPGVGVTLGSARSYQTRAQYSRVALEKSAADTWTMYGDMANGTGGGSGARQTPVVRGYSHMGSSDASDVVAFPAGTAAGDLAVFFAGSGDGFNGITGWTMHAQLGSGWNGGLAFKRLTAGDIEAGNFTVNWAGAFSNIGELIVFEGSTVAGLEKIDTFNNSGAGPFTDYMVSSDAGASFFAVGTNRSGASVNACNVGTQLDTYSFNTGSITTTEITNADGEVYLTMTPTNRGGYDFLYALVSVLGAPS